MFRIFEKNIIDKEKIDELKDKKKIVMQKLEFAKFLEQVCKNKQISFESIKDRFQVTL